MRPAMSDKMKGYFDKITEEVEQLYTIARIARKQGFDPSEDVECPPAHDMAGRVENLVGPVGVADRIRKLKEQGFDQDKITFTIADEIIEGKFENYSDDAKVDRAIRVALAIKTEGVVSAPLEGISNIKIRQDLLGGPPYLSLFFAGPIRAAGGTVQAFAVLIADYVREKMKIAPYVATEDEVGRFVEEVKLYDKLVNLQYPSTIEELKYAVKNLKVELNGEPTEDREVSAYRNMKRIETNQVRSGPCLVLNDGVLLKSGKILKTIDKMKIPGWEWLKEVKKYSHTEDDNKKKKEESAPSKEVDYGVGLYDGSAKIEGATADSQSMKAISPVQRRREMMDNKNPPIFKYISDVIGGRPVFAYPSRVGGHRVRYGRSRNTGLAGCGMNPNTMYILNEFLAVGTQIRIERPGKSSVVMPVSSIEGPVCLLENGDVVQFNELNSYKEITPKNPVKNILFLGDILFGYGEFSENNHTIIPSPYVEEWWAQDLEKAIKNEKIELNNPKDWQYTDFTAQEISNWISGPFDFTPNGKQALSLSRAFFIPLHPKYLYHFGNVNGEDMLEFRDQIKNYYFKNNRQFKDTPRLQIPDEPICKKLLCDSYCPHKQLQGYLEISEDLTPIFIEILALERNLLPDMIYKIEIEAKKCVALDVFPLLTDIKIKDKSPYYMGTRMGRPEKAKERKMKPPVHSLFPLGHDSDNSRVMQNAYENGGIEVDIVLRRCPECNNYTHLNFCSACKKHTELCKFCSQCKKPYKFNETTCSSCGRTLDSFSKRKVTFMDQYNSFISKVHTSKIPDVKGVKGLSSEFKMCEPIEKGILRSMNDVHVFKDGTIRFDALDIPFTHFTPKEIGTSVEKLVQMGYDTDYLGNPLVSDDQVCELKCQDFIATDHCGDYFLKVAKFVDDELEYLYELPRFYKFTSKEDMIGTLFAGLAPHTSAAIIGRLIGFAPINAGYGHPYWHAAKRRNCFPGDSTIFVEIEGNIERIPLKTLYNEYYENEVNDKGVFRKDKPVKKIKVISFDQKELTTLPTDILDVIKFQSPKTLIRINLRTGRSFTTTPDHPVFTVEKDELKIKKALEIKKGDYFIIPKIDLDCKEISNIDLLVEFTQSKYKSDWDKLMIRGVNDFVRSLIEENGLAETSKKLNINKKTLFNYYNKRDSVPYSILRALLNLTNKTLTDVPNCMLGFKGDKTSIKRIIEFDESLAKLIGYYIAEGFYREGARCHQVDLAVTEEDIRNDMMDSIRKVFGEEFQPYINKNRITIGSHAVYLIFKEVFKLTNTARTKRIPPLFLQSPLQILSFILSAYFSGDGSVDTKHPEVNCTSFSKELTRDIDTALLRFGIFSSLAELKREDNIEYKVRIYGENIKTYAQKIGFTSVRKTVNLKIALESLNEKEMMTFGDNKVVPVHEIEIIPAQDDFVYSLHAKTHHSILINENIVTHQCDGDEDGLLLLMDLLLNFSRFYLPSKIGGKMDAPLVLSVTLDPNEVDGEAHNVDASAKYPLEFYEMSEKYPKVADIDAKMSMGLIKKRLGKPDQYEGIKFTHPTKNINFGPKLSSYKRMETMNEKIDSQIDLAVRISSVDAEDVARKILQSHFTPDIMGNLRRFSQQGFRCPSCGAKYRRVTLSGKCNACGGQLLLTVVKGGIMKYLPRALSLCEKFDLGEYTTQRMQLVDEYVKSLTDNPKVKQVKLTTFFK